MPEELEVPKNSPIPASAKSSGQSIARPTGHLAEVVEEVASGLYSLASMLAGEGLESEQLVEKAIADAEISVCQNPAEAIQSSRRALAAGALDLLGSRNPGSLAAPEGLAPASTCIDDDDLSATGISSAELERMISGPDRDRVRKWLASLPLWMRTVFVLRAVAGFNAAETSALLKAHGGPQAASWTPEAAREVFRQGLCSLASQLLQASNEL